MQDNLTSCFQIDITVACCYVENHIFRENHKVMLGKLNVLANVIESGRCSLSITKVSDLSVY